MFLLLHFVVMASPPPGPQPPPQGPPASQPYPPQGYPPQYPQQPYYAPPTPPPQKSNTALILVLIVVVVIVVLAVAAWWAMTVMVAPVNNFSRVTITGVSWVINYNTTNRYFGPSPLTACTTCPFTTSIAQQFQYTLTLHNRDTVAHSLTAVTLGSSFSLVSTVPSLSTPLSVPAASDGSIVLTIQPTTIGGSYTLTGVLTTS